MLRLFLSIDMAGSTRFKSSFSGQAGEGWLETYRAFFTNFPLLLGGQTGRAFFDSDDIPAVDVWKVLGDEIIFVTQPSNADDLLPVLQALLGAMKAYEMRYLDRLPLRLKGTAWLAAFGERNIELDIAELSASDATPHRDFIGPDIDLGFRLSKFARPHCLTLSLDLVEALLGARDGAKTPFYLMGKESLKGVMFERPYPIIWMPDPAIGFDFLAWEAEACPLIAAAMSARPNAAEELRREIDEMRLYLRKMHGIDLAPLSFAR